METKIKLLKLIRHDCKSQFLSDWCISGSQRLQRSSVNTSKHWNHSNKVSFIDTELRFGVTVVGVGRSPVLSLQCLPKHNGSTESTPHPSVSPPTPLAASRDALPRTCQSVCSASETIQASAPSCSGAACSAPVTSSCVWEGGVWCPHTDRTKQESFWGFIRSAPQDDSRGSWRSEQW